MPGHEAARATGRLLHVVSGLLIVAAALGTGGLLLSQARAVPPASRPIEVREGGYVGSETCRSCHPSQYRSWHRSYHRTMTQEASPQAIFGDFSDQRLVLDNQRFELQRRGDRFLVRLEPPKGVPGNDPDGLMTFPITLVTGSHHMQVYWYDTGFHRLLGQVPFIFLKDERRWIPRRQAFLMPPGRPFQAEFGRWNHTCLNCHATHGQPRLSERSEPDTHVAEFGIACEACHGPAETHVARHRSPLARYVQHLSDRPVPDIAHPSKLGARQGSEVCGHRHGVWPFLSDEGDKRWRKDGYRYRPGGRHIDQFLFQPTKLAEKLPVQRVMQDVPTYAEGKFWPDGLARVSGHEYNGMVDSPCYERGELACTSCHTMHKRPTDPRPLDEWADDQLGAGMDGNGACLQCHRSFAEDGALAAHTLHGPESSGSVCYNCHMPYTSYGLLKAIRSHTITTPEVASSRGPGRPNACNLCHLDRSLGWAAEQLEARYGIHRPKLSADEAAVPAAALWSLRGDAGQRALIAWHMGWQPARRAAGEAWLAALLGVLLDDPYDAVRHIAWRSLRTIGGFARFDFDPVLDIAERPIAAPRVFARLRELAPDQARFPRGVLDASYKIDRGLFQRLYGARDNRPIQLWE